MSQYLQLKNYAQLLRSKKLGGRIQLYDIVKPNRQFQTSLEVLREIALSDKAYQYDLPPRIGDSGLSYRTLLRHLETLKKLDLIELDHVEPSSKRGIRKNVLRITFIGMLQLLGNIIQKISHRYIRQDILEELKKKAEPEKIQELQDAYKQEIQDINLIAEKYPEFLPLVFGKWRFFEDKGIKKKVIDHIVIGFFSSYLEGFTRKILAVRDLKEMQAKKDEYETVMKEEFKGFFQRTGQNMQDYLGYMKDIRVALLENEKGSKEIEQETKSALTNVVFGVSPYAQYSMENPKYLMALSEDKEIYDHVTNEMERRREAVEDARKTELTSIENFQSWWKSLRKQRKHT